MHFRDEYFSKTSKLYTKLKNLNMSSHKKINEMCVQYITFFISK